VYPVLEPFLDCTTLFLVCQVFFYNWYVAALSHRMLKILLRHMEPVCLGYPSQIG
jgi:hypothetical protein